MRTSDDSIQHYKVTFALDHDSFFRKACAECGLEYKIEADPADLQWNLGSPVSRCTKAMRSNDDNDDEPHKETCPYCGATSPSNDNHTEEFMRYGRIIIEREAMAPLINQFLSDMDRMFSQFNNSSFIKLTTSGSGFVPPIRPIIGPEPNDMRRIKLLCCNKTIKTLEHWASTIFCPYCATKLILL
jgi:hypothetical protein